MHRPRQTWQLPRQTNRLWANKQDRRCRRGQEWSSGYLLLYESEVTRRQEAMQTRRLGITYLRHHHDGQWVSTMVGTYWTRRKRNPRHNLQKEKRTVWYQVVHKPAREI